MEALPYKLFGTHERAALAAALEGSLAAWAAAWLPTPGAIRIDCAPACETPARRAGRGPGSWIRLAGTQGGEWIAAAVAPDDLLVLAQALCGGADPRLLTAFAGSSEIAGEAADSALHELCASLLGSPQARSTRGDEAAPPQSAFTAGSACYGAEITLGAAKMVLVTGAEWTLRLLRGRLGAPGAAPRLAERRSGVAGQCVALQVVAGWAEMDVAALRGLAVGDVIALDARIDRPLVLAGAAGAPLCHARLGSRGGRRAVALSALRS